MKNSSFALNTVLVIVFILQMHKTQCRHLYENVKIAKCCPEGSELKVTSIVDEESTKYNYECAMITGYGYENQTMFGYNLEINDEIRIPKCGDVEIFEFDVDGGLISSDGCIDMFNGVLHGLRCSDTFQVEVHKLFKCCAEGFSYDITNRQCVDSGQAPDRFVKLIGNSVAVFKTNVPVCQRNEIFVEYQTAIHPSKLMRSGIMLSAYEFDFLKPETFCIDEIVDSTKNDTGIDNDLSIIIRSCRPRNLCRKMPCVRRCCRNEMMIQRINGTSQCVAYERNIKPTFHDVGEPLNGDEEYRIVEPPVYGLINMQECGKFKLSNTDPEDAHYISHIDGSLHVHNFDQPFSNRDYCVEYVYTGTIDMSQEVNFCLNWLAITLYGFAISVIYYPDLSREFIFKYDQREQFIGACFSPLLTSADALHTFVCFVPYPQTKYKFYAAGLTISCVFLTITLICYACLPKLLNLHGKTLVCHVISLLSAYITLAIVQFHTETKMENCYFMAYLIFFGFMAAFCWQSIMCWDIWYTFGSVRTSRGMRKTKELRRFLLYSLYAWSVPSLLTALTVLVDAYELVPDIWSPQMGSKNVCWFGRENWRGHFIFFLFPIGLHILTNAILFILTAIHCSKVKNEIQRMQSLTDNDSQDKKQKFMADKAKYTMNIKLFIVMGVSWSLEILATLMQKPEELWYVADSFNILQGVLVFFIFVFKMKVWHAIQQRLGKVPKNVKGPTTATSTTLLSVTSINGKLGKSCSTSTLSTSNTNLNVIRKIV